MQIQEILLRNFRPYYGETKIQPQTESEKPLVLIQGQNDTGKTSLYTAIRFCLYGAESRDERETHINRRAVTESSGTTKVTITFEHEGELFIIERGIEFEQTDNAESRHATNWYREVRQPDGILVEKDDREQKYRRFINRFIPENIAQFFFFDAEQLEEFEENHDDTVRKSIETVLGIQEIENAIDDLNDREETFERELAQAKSTVNKVNELKQDLTDIRDELDEIGDSDSGKISDKESKIEDKKRSLQEVNKALEKAEGAGDLQEEIEELEMEIKEKEKELENDLVPDRDKIRKEIGPLLATTGANVFSDIFEVQGVRGETGVIQAILDRDKCICGEDLTEEHRQQLLGRFKRLHGKEQRILGEIKELTDELQLGVDAKLDYYGQLQQDIRNTKQEIADLEDKRDEKQAELDSIEQEYSDELKSKKQRLNDEIQKLESEVDKLENRRAVLQSDLEDLKTRIETMEGASEEEQRFSSLINLASRCQVAFEDIKEELVETRRESVEKAASDTFKKLTNRPEYYERLEITQNYELRIVTEDAVRSIEEQDPSAGARQIIAYSFIAGISAYTTRNAPVVIDTPIGRLDPEHKSNLIKHYHEFSDQVAILYQPNELKTDDIEMMEEYIAKHFQITLQDDEVSSTIEELPHIMNIPSED